MGGTPFPQTGRSSLKRIPYLQAKGWIQPLYLLLLTIVFTSGTYVLTNAQCPTAVTIQVTPAGDVCLGATGVQYEAIVTGGDGSQTYAWCAYNNGTGTGTCNGGFSPNATVQNPTRNWTASTGPKSVGVTVSQTGCPDVTNLYVFNVVADPVAPTLNVATPASGTTVCEGSTVSATFNAGSGGTGTPCGDEFQYSTDNGATWSPYTPGDPITAGTMTIIIQGRRNCDGLGCGGLAETFATLASWPVNPLPTFSFTAQVTGDALQNGDNTTNTAVTLDFCVGDNFTLGGFTSAPTGQVGVLVDLTGTGNVTYNAVLVPVPSPQQDLGPLAAASFFNASYGPYGLNSGTYGQFVQTLTPYFDADNSGTYNTGDCLGTAITITYDVYAYPNVTISLSPSPICEGDDVTLSFTDNGATGHTFSIDAMLNGTPVSFTGVTDGAMATYTEGVHFTGSSTLSNIEVTDDVSGCLISHGDLSVTVNPRPVLQAELNGVQVTNSNDGTTDVGTFQVCNGVANNVSITTAFTDLSTAGNVRVYQTVTPGANTNFAPWCNNCQALVGAFTAGTSATASLIDPTMPGSVVITFQAWDDLNNNTVIDPGECTGDVIEYTVTVNPAPSANITPDPASVCEGVDLMLDGGPSGGTTPYATHAWTGAGAASLDDATIQTPTFNNATAGPYALTYTVTDANGCTATDNISVTVNPNPAAPTAGTATKDFCYGLGLAPNLANSGVIVSTVPGANERIVWELVSAPANSDLTPGLLNDCAGAATAVYDNELRITNASRTIRVDNGAGSVDIVNNLGDPIYGTYTFNAYVKNCVTGCISPATGGFSITIKERPVLDLPNFAPTVCSDNPLSSGNWAGFGLEPTVSGQTVNIASMDYNSKTVHPSLTDPGTFGANAAMAVTGQTVNYIDNDNYTNKSTGGRIVTYNVTVNGDNGCASDPTNYPFSIMAEPQMQNDAFAVCSGDPTSYNFSLAPGSWGNVPGPPNSVNFNIVSIVVDPMLTPDPGNAVVGSCQNFDAIANDSWINNTGGPLTVVYTVAPQRNCSSTPCDGDQVTITVTVNDTAEPTIGVGSKEFCYGDPSITPGLAGTGVRALHPGVTSNAADVVRIVWTLTGKPAASDLTVGDEFTTPACGAPFAAFDGEIAVSWAGVVRVNSNAPVNNMGDPIYGTYEFTAYAENCITGCKSDPVGPFTITIHSPITGVAITVDPAGDVCLGAMDIQYDVNFTGGSGNYNYAWCAYNNGTGTGTCFNGFSDNTIKDPTRSWVASTGPKSVGVTVTDQACPAFDQSAEDLYAFMVVADPDITSITAVPDPVCTDATVDLEGFHTGGTGTVSYNWEYSTTGGAPFTPLGTTNPISDIPTNPGPGLLTYTYQLTVSYDGPGCDDATLTEDVVVKPTLLPFDRIFNNPAANAGLICNGDVADVDVDLDPSQTGLGYVEGVDYQFEIFRVQHSVNATGPWTNGYGPITGGVGYSPGDVISDIVESLTHDEPNIMYIRYRVKLVDLICGTEIIRNIRIGIYPKPDIECPAPITVGTSSGGTGDCFGDATFTHPTELNGACPNVFLTMVIDNGPTIYSVDQGEMWTETLSEGTHTVDYTVIDGNNNTDMCTLTIIVEDDEDPIPGCEDITVYLDDMGNASITPDDIEDGTSFDNCGLDPNGYSLDISSFTCADVPSVVVTLTATDIHSRTGTCTATVTVVDNIPPDAVCKDITVYLDDMGDASILPADVDDGSTDNCGIVDRTLSRDAFGCGDVGTPVVVTLTVEDAAGLTDDCTATVTVLDEVDPDAKCKNITISLNDNGTYTLAPGEVDNGSTDACGIASMSVFPNFFSCEDIPGPTLVELTVTDVNGNVGTCDAEVTINDFIWFGTPDVTVTHETCTGYADGTITIHANTTSSNQLLYSINNGVWYTTTNVFTGLTPGTYDIKVFVQGTPDCYITTTATVNMGGTPTTWYKDLDGDGYTDGLTQFACVAPTGYVASALPGDCNDNNADINPVTVWYKDADNDGYSDGTTFIGCTPPLNYKLAGALSGAAVDCNDADATVYPGAPELCDNKDNDCDGSTDEDGGQIYNGNVTFANQTQVNAWLACYGVINGNLTIAGTTINNLGPLANITQVTGSITIQSTSLANLNGLSNLDIVGGNLVITSNFLLTTLSGLEGISSVGGNLNVFFNSNLNICCGIYHLVDINPANGSVGGVINVYFNKPGGNCISVAKILMTCAPIPLVGTPDTGVNTVPSTFKDVKTMTLFPNPTSSDVTVRINGEYLTGKLIVFDGTGRVMTMNDLTENTPEQTLNVSGWAPGMYMVRLQLDGEAFTQKLIVQ